MTKLSKSDFTQLYNRDEYYLRRTFNAEQVKLIINLVNDQVYGNIEIIDTSKIHLKESTVDDWDFILKLRNKYRENFGSTTMLKKEDHYKYLRSFTGKIWIVYYGEKKSGFLKLNGQDLAIVLDYLKGKGVSKHVLKMGIAKTDGNLTAVIKKDNISSLKLYKSAGYRQVGIHKDMILFEI